MHWFLVAILVLLLVTLHDLFVVQRRRMTKEVQMNANQTNSTNTTSGPTMSFFETIWAMGTSVAAGALSA
jgi:hypothetical protein